MKIEELFEARTAQTLTVEIWSDTQIVDIDIPLQSQLSGMADDDTVAARFKDIQSKNLKKIEKAFRSQLSILGTDVTLKVLELNRSYFKIEAGTADNDTIEKYIGAVNNELDGKYDFDIGSQDRK